MFAWFRVLVRALCRGAASASLRACGVLFLREQERDWRVQRSSSVNSRVGVAAPSDPVGSILVEILHSVEGGDVEQVCSNLETILSCLRLLSPYLSLVFISCLYLLLISITCLIYTCAILSYTWGLFAHTYIQPRESKRYLNSYLEES